MMNCGIGDDGGMGMDAEKIEKIKNAIAYLKIARGSGYVVFRAMLDGKTFNEEVLIPLQKIVGWNEKDEERIVELSDKFQKETNGKTLKEKSDKLKNILKIGAGGLMLFGAYQFFKKDKK